MRESEMTHHDDFKSEVKILLQATGDAIADAFEQMLRGNWVDDLGHSVKTNNAMLALRLSLIRMMEFRTKHLDYEAIPEDLVHNAREATP
jgi:hypothetical protein